MTNRAIFMIIPFIINTSCMADLAENGDIESAEAIGTIEQNIALAQYSASSSTSSATYSGTTARIPIAFSAGETIMIGTQGITDSSFEGNTYLRLRTASGSDLVTNDDYCNALGSRLFYTAPSAATHTIWAGCSGSTACGTTNPNVVAIARRKGTFPFSASNTNNATVNTINKQYYFNGGETIRASTCGAEAPGASTIGDTWLRIYKNNGGAYTEMAENDQAYDYDISCNCGNSSLIMYTIPSAGYYQVRVGCYLNMSCNGTVAVYTE